MPRSSRAETRTGLLSRQERRVLEMTAVGKLDKEIAHEMTISIGTLREYLVRSKAKLGVDTREALVLAAWQTGQIDLRALATAVTGKPWAMGAA